MYLDYAQLVTQRGIPKSIFDEIKTLDEVDFHHGEFLKPHLLTSAIASEMHFGLLSEALAFGMLKEFDAKLINDTFGLLKRENMRLFDISQSPTNSKKHPVYDILYSVEKLNPNRVTTNAALKLPKPNPYIPRSFNLLKTNLNVVALAETPRGSLWYAGNPTDAPKAEVHVLLQHHVENVDAQVALDMLADALNLELSEQMYAAQGAGLSIQISSTTQGLYILLSGYSEHMERLVNETMRQIKGTEFSEDVFLYARERTLLGYSFFALSDPLNQADYSTQTALENNVWPYPALNTSAMDTTYKGFQAFAGSFLGARSKVLVVGNVARETASRMGEFTLPAKAPAETSPPAVVAMPKGDFVFRFPLASPSEQNSAIEFYLELYVYPDIPAKTMSGFMAFLLKPLTFNQLRSKEQLGYSVRARDSDFKTRGGISFRISGVYDPVHLESIIEELLVTFRKYLKNMAVEELRNLVEAYAVSLKTSTLWDRADEIWKELVRDNYRSQKDLDIRKELSSITTDKLLAVVDDKILKGGSDRRKFSTHAVSGLAKKVKSDYTLESCGCRVTDLANWKKNFCHTAYK